MLDWGQIAGSAVLRRLFHGWEILGKRMERKVIPKEAWRLQWILTARRNSLIIRPSNVLIVFPRHQGGVCQLRRYSFAVIAGFIVGLFLWLLRPIMVKIQKASGWWAALFDNVGIEYFLEAVPEFYFFVGSGWIGGIIGGVFTATEARLLPVVYSLILSLIYVKLASKDLSGGIAKSQRHCCGWCSWISDFDGYVLGVSSEEDSSNISNCHAFLEWTTLWWSWSWFNVPLVIWWESFYGIRGDSAVLIFTRFSFLLWQP